MNCNLTKDQIDFYTKHGFVVIEDFLNEEELMNWREVVFESVEERNGLKMPGKTIKLDQYDNINNEPEYYSKVFDQFINIWQTNKKMKELIVDQRIGQMAAKLAKVEGLRIWHDQALIKRPWANPTSWHIDTPFWSFFDKRALSIWVALDDVTLENGCLFFIPGSHLQTNFENPGIGKNMDAIFDIYPQIRSTKPIAAPMKAGSCSFHCGMTIHGAQANMTPGIRRAMTCAFMPDGNLYNGQPNILPDTYLKKIKVGDILNNDEQNPLVNSS